MLAATGVSFYVCFVGLVYVNHILHEDGNTMWIRQFEDLKKYFYSSVIKNNCLIIVYFNYQIFK